MLPEPIECKHTKLEWIFQVLVLEKDCTLSKRIPIYGFKYVKTSGELLRIAKRIVDEVLTGICGLLGNDADDAEFIKSQYRSSTCTN